MFTYTNKCWQLDLVNKNYKLSYMNIIYRETMVRLMHKKYSQILMMKYSVLLFINSALVFCFFVFFFTKILSTVYTGLYIIFLFSHINITHPKTGTTTIKERSTQEKSKHTHKNQTKPPPKVHRELVLNMVSYIKLNSMKWIIELDPFERRLNRKQVIERKALPFTNRPRLTWVMSSFNLKD